ncbi:MAG: ABC transporter permease [Candidatus Dormibacteria bacterium]
MFFRLLGTELRSRPRQAIFAAVAFAVGVAMVMTVIASATAVKSAQGQVLHSLYGVGTDISVTKAPKLGSGGPFHFAFPGSGSGAGSGSGSGIQRSSTPFNGNHVMPIGGQAEFSQTYVSKVARLTGVESAAGGLALRTVHFNGSFQPGQGAFGGGGGAFNISTTEIDGVSLDNSKVGPLSGGSMTSGHYFGSGDSHSPVALVSDAYAKQHGTKAGSHLSLDGTSFTVLGLVSLPSSGTGADVYIPLAEAQKLAGATDKVNAVYVQASSASSVNGVASEIRKAVPGSSVTTASDLASQVSSSLGTASSLGGSLGTGLAIVVLIVAFGLAALMTMASVTRRVREFGTLKAIGWKTSRIVSQVMGEALAAGVVGAAAGVGLGFLGAFLVTRAAGPIHAALPNQAAPARFASRFGGLASRSHLAGLHTVTVHLSPGLGLDIIGLAVGLALAGAVLAGLLGGWRVARLSPANALRRVE